MQNKHVLIALACALASAAPMHTAIAAESAAERQLMEQGRYWQQRQDTARASEAWNKLLQVRPDNAEALLGLGRLAAQARQADKARGYLAQVKRLHPSHPDIALLEQAIALLGEGTAAVLDRARQEKNPDDAVKHYRELFNGREPQGKLAVEYYSVLGYTKDGWAEAVAGLERLRKQAPDDPQITLALARLWVLRTDTRIQGIRTLATLATRKDVGTEATRHWREALSWLGAPPPPSTAALFEAYLQSHPDDETIRSQYRAQRPVAGGGASAERKPARVDPFGGHVQSGFDALRDDNVPAAEQAFAAALRLRPADASALGGMGLVKLEQKRFGEARDLLALASAKGEPSQWKTALDSATYWDLVDQARVARDADRLDDAVKLLERARLINEREPTATIELGRVYAALQSAEDAEKAYREVLAQDPENLAALQGLVGVLASTNRGNDALQLIDGLSPSVRERLDVGRLRAERSMAQGRIAADRSELESARSYYEDAVAQSPDDPWLRLELARLLQRLGRSIEAVQVTDPLLTGTPRPEALYVAALVRADLQDWTGAYELAGRIPEARRTADMKALVARTSLQAGLAQALALVRRGELAQARSVLAPLAERAGGDAVSVGAVASAYADAGDAVRARALMREALARERQPSVGLRLQYAGLLLQLGGADTEFASTMRGLREAPLTAEQRRQYEDLQRGYGLRQAEALRQRGELALAFEALRPLLAAMPRDPLVLGALARMYTDAGRPAEALQLYGQALAQLPDDLGTLRSAAGAAAASGDLEMAERLFLRALTVAPDDPQMLVALAQLYRQQGKDSKALPLLRQAESAQRGRYVAQTPAPAAAPGQPRIVSVPADNPFATLER